MSGKCHIPLIMNAKYQILGHLPSPFNMYVVVVLNEKQRVAKRRLIEDNRERRRVEQTRMKIKHEQCYHDCLTDDDRSLIGDIVGAYEQTSIKITKTYTIVSLGVSDWEGAWG